jgi:hypothetical protein
MAFYTSTNLPRSPSHCTMNATLPSLPTELLSSWAMWRPSKHQTPLTPPMSSVFHRRPMLQDVRVTTTLPPIAHLDRHLSAMPPLTPPDEIPIQNHPPPTPRLPQMNNYPSDAPGRPSDNFFHSKPSIIPEDPPVVDWLDFTHTQSAHSIAEKTCEMICYLWFSSPSSPYSSPQSNGSPPYFHRPKPATTTLQLVATRTFVQFMQKLLETTQVSQSVIVLSLHYIYRLKERNRFTAGQAGSEFRIAVAALMMANKFLDDNTYTNKTWAEVSGIELAEISRMEREFLMGVDFSLYVDKATYESWLNLLKGLVMAKERDSRHFRKSRVLPRASRRQSPHSSTGPPARTYSSKYRTPSLRARSTSPGQTSRSLPVQYPSSHISSHASSAVAEPSSPTPRPGSKRSAAAAFSPTSASFSNLPYKRPVSISLQIPELASGNGSNSSSYSPLEGLQSFAKMSIASPHVPQQSSQRAHSPWVSPARGTVPETLVTAYSVDEGRRAAVPQNLYFYALSCLPMDNEEESRWRKARLRYHQPAPPAPSYCPSQPTIPLDIQSASASPHDVHVNVASHALPSFPDTLWTRQPVTAPRSSIDTQTETRYPYPGGFTESPIPSAPFANAGPPGVQFYSTPVKHSPPYGHNWSRNRPLYNR